MKLGILKCVLLYFVTFPTLVQQQGLTGLEFLR